MSENNNTYQFIQKLAESKGVSKEKIKEIFITSFRNSYCQGENAGVELQFEFDAGLSVRRLYKIVETVKDPEKEITKDNKLIKEGKVEGNIFLLPLDIKNLSFSLNQEIRNRWLHKDLGEIQEKKQYEFFKPREGKLVIGSIQSIQKNYCLVNLGKGVGRWEEKWDALPEKLYLGQKLYFLVKEVQEKAPQILLTRYDDLFLKKLLALEIPEIKEGIINIRDILRIPGSISKVIVESKKPRVEALGTCIGKNGERIKALSRLVYPERLDLAAWTEDKKQLLFNLLSPVKFKESQLTITEVGEWKIIVPQHRASLLLQYEGKMIKKISNYLGVKIHLKILEELEETERDKFAENKGQILQEVGSYKNVKVQIIEEIEK